MKFLITFPASLTRDKKPKIIPERRLITEAFNVQQAQRRTSAMKDASKDMTIEPLDKWIEAIPTL